MSGKYEVVIICEKDTIHEKLVDDTIISEIELLPDSETFF